MSNPTRQQEDLGAPTGIAPLRITKTDDPRVVEEQRHEDYVNHVVPSSMRVGRWQMAMSYWSLLSALVWMFYGALAATLYGTQDALIAIVLSVAIYATISGLFARWSIRTGANATMLSRQTFGVVGSLLTAYLLAASSTFYAVFESSTLAIAAKEYTNLWPIEVWYAIVCVGMLPLMLGGVRTFMAKLNGFSLPFYYIGMAAAVIAAFVKFGEGSDWFDWTGVVPPEARPYPGWFLALLLFLGLFLLIANTSDFARFGKVEDAKFHSRVSFGWVFMALLLLVNGVAGIILARVVVPDLPPTEAGVVTAILASLGFAGLVLIVLSQGRVNTLNYYEASANLSRIITALTGRKIPRLLLVALLTALVFGLMLTNVFSYFEMMLRWQGAFLGTWVGVLLTHYFLIKGWKNTEMRSQRVGKVTPGLVVWLVSTGVALWLMEGPNVSPAWSALAPVIGIALSIVLYAIVFVATPPRLSKVQDVRLEVDDVWSDYIECAYCGKSYVAYEMDRSTVAEDQRAACDSCAVAQHSHTHH